MFQRHKIFLRSLLLPLLVGGGSLLGSPTPSYAQGDLNAQLRTAVCSQNWGGAIVVVDRMRPLVPSNSPSQGQLINYRQQLENLVRVNLRLDNWTCVPNQPIPALPLSTAENPVAVANQGMANPTPGNTSSPRATSDREFWDGFLDIADARTERLARNLGQAQLRQYAARVCSILQQGGSMRDVPAIDTGNSPTPRNFQLTLQEASVSAYCPAYIDKLN